MLIGARCGGTNKDHSPFAFSLSILSLYVSLPLSFVSILVFILFSLSFSPSVSLPSFQSLLIIFPLPPFSPSIPPLSHSLSPNLTFLPFFLLFLALSLSPISPPPTSLAPPLSPHLSLSLPVSLTPFLRSAPSLLAHLPVFFRGRV